MLFFLLRTLLLSTPSKRTDSNVAVFWFLIQMYYITYNDTAKRSIDVVCLDSFISSVLCAARLDSYDENVQRLSNYTVQLSFSKACHLFCFFVLTSRRVCLFQTIHLSCWPLLRDSVYYTLAITALIVVTLHVQYRYYSCVTHSYSNSFVRFPTVHIRRKGGLVSLII